MIRLNQSQTEAAPRGLIEGGHVPERRTTRNVGETERAASVVAGVLLTGLGFSRRGVGGMLATVAGGALLYRGLTGTCPAYSALEIDTATDQPALHVDQVVTIDRPATDLYRFWRSFENLPTIMPHLLAVSSDGDGRSRWTARGPAIFGGRITWDAELLEDVPNERLAWRSLPGAVVEHVGSVKFEPGPRGTAVRFASRYVAPAGRVGAWAASLLGHDPQQQIREGLRRFKQLMEVGEIPTTQGQPRGTCAGASRIGRLFR